RRHTRFDCDWSSDVCSSDLTSTLTQLSQAPPPGLADSSIKDVWKWALEHWNPQALAGKTEVRLSARGDSKAESKRENCGVQEGRSEERRVGKGVRSCGRTVR